MSLFSNICIYINIFNIFIIVILSLFALGAADDITTNCRHLSPFLPSRRLLRCRLPISSIVCFLPTCNVSFKIIFANGAAHECAHCT